MRQLSRAPLHIRRKLTGWIKAVELDGLEVVRVIPGYHDEALKGARAGQRSIRLNRSWRAIYVVLHNEVEFVSVREVGNHDY